MRHLYGLQLQLAVKIVTRLGLSLRSVILAHEV